MDKEIYAAMIEATQFTREGRVNEATQRIQRALRLGGMGTGVFTSPMGESEPVEARFRLTAEPAAVPGTSEAEGHAQTRTEEEHWRAFEPHIETAGTKRWATLLHPSLRRRGGQSLPGILRGRRKRGPHPHAAPAGGQWIEKFHTNIGGTHAYKLFVPSRYAGQPMPLVIMLHGCTQDPDDFAAGTGMNFLAEEAGFLVAYPAQTNCANASKCWNWFQAGHQQRGKGEPLCIAGITREVMSEYHADPGRIYVAGLSAGGAMAAIMGVAYPELYAAVGVHSGLAAGCAHDLPSAFAAMQHGGRTGKTGIGSGVPLILFHGDQDATVHPDNADDLIRQWAGAEPVASRATAPSVMVRQGQAAGGRSYTCEIYQDARREVLVERWIIHGAGHSWSGGSPSGSYTDPSGPDASREMMRFFQEHPRETTAPPPAE